MDKVGDAEKHSEIWRNLETENYTKYRLDSGDSATFYMRIAEFCGMVAEEYEKDARSEGDEKETSNGG